MNTLEHQARMRRTAALLAACSATLLLAACAVGPDYVRPDLDLPSGYLPAGTAPQTAPERHSKDQIPAPQSLGEAAVSDQRFSGRLDLPAQWWETFHSPSLNALVTTSLEHNPSLTAAQAALRAARENVGAQQAVFWPSATTSFVPTRQRVAAALASPASSDATYYNLHTAQLSIAYAPDVFGGTRRSVESARAQAEYQCFQTEATYLTLSANVVTAAITEASLRAQRKAILAIIDDQRQQLQSTRRLFTLGQLAMADVALQEAALATAAATLPPIDKQLAVQRDLLATLAGRYPADGLGEGARDSQREKAGAGIELDELQLTEELPLTLPAILVEHRPDVRAAEAQLHAASAEIGIAVAARLPNVTLGVTGYGSSAYAVSDLFSPSTIFWTLGGSVIQPVFDGGALKHREAAARASFDQAAALYRATVLGAFQDVADTLQALNADTRALHAALDAERANAKSLALTRKQLQLGDVSPVAVLVAEQSDQQARLNRIQAQASRLSDVAALFQALGGGWWNRGKRSESRSELGSGSEAEVASCQNPGLGS